MGDGGGSLEGFPGRGRWSKGFKRRIWVNAVAEPMSFELVSGENYHTPVGVGDTF